MESSYIDVLFKVALLPSVSGLIYWVIKSMRVLSERQQSYFGERMNQLSLDFSDIKRSLKEATEANLAQHTQIYHRLDDFDRRQEDARLLTIKVKELAATNQELNAQSITRIYNTITRLPCVIPAKNGELNIASDCPEKILGDVE